MSNRYTGRAIQDAWFAALFLSLDDARVVSIVVDLLRGVGAMVHVFSTVVVDSMLVVPDTIYTGVLVLLFGPGGEGRGGASERRDD